MPRSCSSRRDWTLPPHIRSWNDDVIAQMARRETDSMTHTALT
jgi:hypothetical protein